MIETEEVRIDEQPFELPFELPEHMRGLEDLVAEDSVRLAIDENGNVDRELFNRMTGYVAREFDRRIRSYWALARIATDPNSLPYRLKNSPYVLNEPELFNPAL